MHALLIFGKALIRFFEAVDSVSYLDSINANWWLCVNISTNKECVKVAFSCMLCFAPKLWLKSQSPKGV